MARSFAASRATKKTPVRRTNKVREIIIRVQHGMVVEVEKPDGNVKILVRDYDNGGPEKDKNGPYTEEPW